MELAVEEKELLVRAFKFYYENHVWSQKNIDKDSKGASDEDYRIRHLADKLGFRGMFPSEIQSRF